MWVETRDNGRELVVETVLDGKTVCALIPREIFDDAIGDEASEGARRDFVQQDAEIIVNSIRAIKNRRFINDRYKGITIID